MTYKFLKTKHINIHIGACYNEISYQLKIATTSRSANASSLFNNSNHLWLDYKTTFFDPNITFNYHTTRDSFMQLNFGFTIDYKYFNLAKSHWSQRGYPTTVVDLPFFEKGAIGFNLHFGIFLDFLYGKYPTIKL